LEVQDMIPTTIARRISYIVAVEVGSEVMISINKQFPP